MHIDSYNIKIVVFILIRSHLLGKMREDQLILLVLENIKHKNMSPLLRHLMTTHVYLKWSKSSARKQWKFWSTLGKALSDSEW